MFSITSIGQSIKIRILQRVKRLHLSGSNLHLTDIFNDSYDSSRWILRIAMDNLSIFSSGHAFLFRRKKTNASLRTAW